jgi:hypothetical protein
VEQKRDGKPPLILYSTAGFNKKTVHDFALAGFDGTEHYEIDDQYHDRKNQCHGKENQRGSGEIFLIGVHLGFTKAPYKQQDDIQKGHTHL